MKNSDCNKKIDFNFEYLVILIDLKQIDNVPSSV